MLSIRLIFRNTWEHRRIYRRDLFYLFGNNGVIALVIIGSLINDSNCVTDTIYGNRSYLKKQPLKYTIKYYFHNTAYISILWFFYIFFCMVSIFLSIITFVFLHWSILFVKSLFLFSWEKLIVWDSNVL